MICDEAHTALGEKTSAAIRVVQRADLHRHDRDRAADREAGLGRLPGLGRRPAARRRRAPRADRAAALPARAAGRRDQLGADRRRRLRGARARRSARPPGAQPGGGEPLPRALRHDAGHRLRRRRRPRLQPRAGVPRRRAQGRGRLGQDAAGQARRDARRLRARRDQRPDQRAAARRGLELAARDRLHPPRADRVAPRLPAADRPDHAHAPAQGGRHRRRLRAEGPTHNDRVVSLHSLLDADFYREGARVTPAPRRRQQRRARRRLSPAPWLVPVTPDVAPAARGDPARVAADRPEVPRRRRAALLGDDRRAGRSASTSAPSSRASSPRAAPARARSRRSSPSAPPRTRTAGCG